MRLVKVPREVDTKLDQIDSVATLPHIATEVLEVMRGQNSSMRKIAAVIEKDPSITVKILKIANSPLWGAVGKIESVQRALVLLGLKQVSNIVIAISLYSTFAQLKPNPYFNRDRFWRHAIGTAQIARKLSTRLSINFNGEEFVAGLIHDLGKIIMDQFFTEQFQQIVQEANTTDQPFYVLERKYMDCTHAEIGAALLERWNFPQQIISAMQYHHYPEKAPAHKEIAAMIFTANWLAKRWEAGEELPEQPEHWENTGLEILTASYPGVAEFDLAMFLSELAGEMDREAPPNKLMTI